MKRPIEVYLQTEQISSRGYSPIREEQFKVLSITSLYSSRDLLLTAEIILVKLYST